MVQELGHVSDSCVDGHLKETLCIEAQDEPNVPWTAECSSVIEVSGLHALTELMKEIIALRWFHAVRRCNIESTGGTCIGMLGGSIA